MSAPETPPPARRPLQLPYHIAVGGVLALLFGMSLATAFEAPDLAVEGPAAATTPRRPERAPMALESLTCFTCHSLETYHEGGEGAFPHDMHLDMLGIEGCHDCHAFVNHAPVIRPSEACADCH